MPAEGLHYRAPMRSRLPAVPPYAGTARGLDLDLCGIGGRLVRAPADLDDAIVATEREYGERAARRLARFAAVPRGSVMWTRAADGQVYRGRLTGPWAYDASRTAREADLVHVRECAWEPVAARWVPAAVAEAFARGGRNFQRIATLAG